MNQATNDSNRYKPVTHKGLKIGDIVLIKEVNYKPSNYPLAIEKSLQVNDLGEVTGATLLKGSTREMIKRHSSTIIPILRCDSEDHLEETADPIGDPPQQEGLQRVRMKVAEKGEEATRSMLN